MATVINPYLGSDRENGWAMGFSWGFLGPAFSGEPPLVIEPDQFDAFNEGVLAGQQTAIEGLSICPTCVSLRQEVSPGSETIMGGVHLIEGAGLLRAAGHVAHFAAEGLVSVFLLLIPGPPLLSATEEFADRSRKAREKLIELGLGQNSLFLGAGVDEDSADCEISFTPIFNNLDATRSAVQALVRPQWMLAQWDADAPMSGGGFRVIESSSE